MKPPPLGLKKKHNNLSYPVPEQNVWLVCSGYVWRLYMRGGSFPYLSNGQRGNHTSLSGVMLPWKCACCQWLQKYQVCPFSIKYPPDIRGTVNLITTFLQSPLKHLECLGSTSSSLSSSQQVVNSCIPTIWRNALSA